MSITGRNLSLGMEICFGIVALLAMALHEMPAAILCAVLMLVYMTMAIVFGYLEREKRGGGT